MLNLIISSLYFILPAYIANIAPPVFAKLSGLKSRPISGKLFGSHKTFSGFYTGYIGAFLTLLVQFMLSKKGIFSQYELINYQSINIFLYAFLFGIGAPAGDLIKSFFKRMLKIKPGAPFIPFDQLDFVIGALFFIILAQMFFSSLNGSWNSSLSQITLSWPNLLVIFIATPILHFSANIIGYFLKIKKVWW